MIKRAETLTDFKSQISIGPLLGEHTDHSASAQHFRSTAVSDKKGKQCAPKTPI